jgi:hypothetical protein
VSSRVTPLPDSRGLRQVRVTKEDRKRADEASAAVTRIRQAAPGDDHPQISDFDEWTGPHSTASLRRTAGDLILKTFGCHFAC